MSHVFRDIYEHLSEKGSKMATLLQKLNEAVRCDEKNVIKELERTILHVGYVCDWNKEWEASWAWDVSNYIYTGAEGKLEILFHPQIF
jgi:hypothetical protein